MVDYNVLCVFEGQRTDTILFRILKSTSKYPTFVQNDENWGIF